MRTTLALVSFLALGFYSATQAEDIIFPPKDFRCCPTRTTLIDILHVHDLKAKNLPATIDITITKWEETYYTDAAGRSWILFRGPAVTGKPEKLTGWFLFSFYRQEFFFTSSGALFRLAGPHELCAKGAAKKVPLADLKAAIERK